MDFLEIPLQELVILVILLVKLVMEAQILNAVHVLILNL
jgi:hypothetical protein